MITPSLASAVTPADTDLVARARDLSPFFARTLDSDAGLLPELVEGLHRPFSTMEMRDFLGGGDAADETALKKQLRRLRKQVMLRLIARDLGGLADLAEVVETCTALAEVAITHALQCLERWQAGVYGNPVGEETAEPQQMIVVGMGKLGGGELNVSSDIDLIFAYEEDGETSGPKVISNHEFFARLGKKLIAMIGETTEDGFVFRVDMRLRPYGDSGPLVGSLSMLEEYYLTQGREWERYAWIKGRVIAGPAEDLQSLLRPFVFRRYLDYGAFSSMRDLKVQIMREVSRRDMHHNIKLGPGGIREIEFIAQVFQLIRGGSDRALQIRPTLQVLSLVEKKGLLPDEVVAGLQEAYVFLRCLEHRLQYLQDAQTQMLPTDDENRSRIARSMGFPEWDEFYQELQCHRACVERHFAEVFSMQGEEKPQPSLLDGLWQGRLAADEAERLLTQHGYDDASATLHRLQASRSEARYRQLPAISRSRLDALMPEILRLSGGCVNADVTLTRMLDLLESICKRASYLALLAEYPQALELLTRLASASPWLARYLALYPILLDELLDTRSLYASPDFAALRNTLDARLAEAAGDVEQQMDIMRHFKHSQVFHFAAQDLAGEVVLEKLSDYLSALADIMLQATLDCVWPTVRGRHRDAPRFAVIGYGKLGGKELGYASDLDIIFLYDDETAGAGEVYARYAQRINNWLNSLTPAGQLYETDLRLRPDGASGLLVSSVKAFEEYQRQKAWVWEHQALTRARYCAGDAAIGARFEQIRQHILCQRRDPGELREDVLAMRQKMHDGHPNNSELFDIKHDAGGIVDVEFLVQYLVLAHAPGHPGLTGNIGNIALLRLAGELGLVESSLASRVAHAYRDYRREQHAQRLQGMDKVRIPSERFAGHIAAVRELWQCVFG